MRKLTCQNPQAPGIIVSYNCKHKQFERNDNVPQHVLHFSMEGTTILKSSAYGNDQVKIEQHREKNVG